ncbi:MAG: hypothetical protein ACPHID_04765 [Thermoplasmatota archaeon]
MVADPDAFIRLMDELPPQQLRQQDIDQVAAGRSIYLAAPKSLLWKSVLLLVATLAFVPILLMKHELAGAIYVAALVIVHVVGLVVIVAKSGDQWWQDKRALAWRLGGIGVLTVLLSIVGKGLVGSTGLIFWGTLGLIWLLHTVGALIFHLRGDPRACPIPGIGA